MAALPGLVWIAQIPQRQGGLGGAEDSGVELRVFMRDGEPDTLLAVLTAGGKLSEEVAVLPECLMGE